MSVTITQGLAAWATAAFSGVRLAVYGMTVVNELDESRTLGAPPYVVVQFGTGTTHETSIPATVDVPYQGGVAAAPLLGEFITGSLVLTDITDFTIA